MGMKLIKSQPESICTNGLAMAIDFHADNESGDMLTEVQPEAAV